MQPGLKAMLERIRADPNSAQLTKRFLELLKDETDSLIKASSMLRLAEVIINRDHQLALETAYSAYRLLREHATAKAKQLSIDAMEVIAQILSSQGKALDAAAIRTEATQFQRTLDLAQSNPPIPAPDFQETALSNPPQPMTTGNPTLDLDSPDASILPSSDPTFPALSISSDIVVPVAPAPVTPTPPTPRPPVKPPVLPVDSQPQQALRKTLEEQLDDHMERWLDTDAKLFFHQVSQISRSQICEALATHMDRLISEGRYRTLLLRCWRLLATERNIELARAVYPAIFSAWQNLGLRPESWQDADGVDQLTDLLTTRRLWQ